MSSSYGFTKKVPVSVEKAVALVTAALKEEGFGVLTQIDVQATLQAKLGVATAGYRILGACNPMLAHQSLQIEPALGLLLPCNVIVYENRDESGVESSTVSIVDPERMLEVAQNPALKPIAEEASRRLRRVLFEHT